jgi:hypothetical protein
LRVFFTFQKIGGFGQFCFGRILFMSKRELRFLTDFPLFLFAERIAKDNCFGTLEFFFFFAKNNWTCFRDFHKIKNYWREGGGKKQ